MLLTLVMIAPQFGGYGVILAYNGLIFEASGTELPTSIALIIIGVAQILSGLLSIFTVDLIGRRPLFMLSLCGVVLSLAGTQKFVNISIAVW